jgi:metal-sulfur cluster biosynthetic enzyme
MAAPLGLQASAAADYPHDELWDALREVMDPEMGISLVDMGMIVDARREGDCAHIALTYTAMGCPATDMIDDDICGRVRALPGITRVEIDVVWDPVWSKARLTADGRDALLLLGVAL